MSLSDFWGAPHRPPSAKEKTRALPSLDMVTSPELNLRTKAFLLMVKVAEDAA